MDRLQWKLTTKKTIGIAEVESLCNKKNLIWNEFSYRQYLWSDRSWQRKWGASWSKEHLDIVTKESKIWRSQYDSNFYLWECFNDRLLAIELAQILSDANIGTDKILNMLKAHSEEIFSCLDSYPEYFKDRLSVLMK